MHVSFIDLCISWLESNKVEEEEEGKSASVAPSEAPSFAPAAFFAAAETPRALALACSDERTMKNN